MDELERARWLVFIGAYVRCLIRTWMKIYVICHTCVHVLVDTIAVRVNHQRRGLRNQGFAANLVGGTVPAIL